MIALEYYRKKIYPRIIEPVIAVFVVLALLCGIVFWLLVCALVLCHEWIERKLILRELRRMARERNKPE